MQICIPPMFKSVEEMASTVWIEAKNLGIITEFSDHHIQSITNPTWNSP